jgi:hypothetical protein
MIDRRFDRASFERSADRDGLCKELEAILEARLRAAPDWEREGHALVEALRGLGHALPIDEAGHRVRLDTARPYLDVHYGTDEDDEPYALVRCTTERLCPECGIALSPAQGDLRIDLPSDGSLSSPSAEALIEIPGRPAISKRLGGVRSRPLRLEAWSCPKCHGCWLPRTDVLAHPPTRSAR